MNRRSFSHLIHLILVAIIGYIIGFFLGGHSIKGDTPKVCPSEENKGKLVASSHSKDGVVCVYMEPWKPRGKTRRVEL